jgi:prevent-host-death family protein
MKTELVTTLKRKATEIIADVADSRDPVLITQHGRPAAYIVDIETFEGLTRRLKILEAISLGERDVAEGRAITHQQARKRLARWLK